ncbi:hypothetical protein [Alistipes megaguti]|uniref:hypothetical protein n=1 Tax=Alistipes megaguti TaxID=2364787 RepID=UPI002357E686|nr:hypothetical protein [Alistipes megaguti]
MKRIFATLMLAALALSSCVKENDSYKDWLPVRPGQYIYTYVMTQDRVAMQAANAGMRVAVMAAEVAKQREAGDQSVTMENVEYEGKSLLKLLFNPYKEIGLEEVAEGYKLTFDPNYQMPGGFYLGGSLLVHTNGAPALTGGAEWSVEMLSDFKVYSASTYGEKTQIDMNGGTTTLTDNQDGSYTIRVSGIVASVASDEGSKIVSSNWSTGAGGLVVRPADEGVTLAYSSCHGKTFEVDGSASGPSIYASTNETPLHMAYKVSEGRFVGLQIIGGTQECEFTSAFEYNTSAFPAPDVRVEWTNGNSRIYYNGYVYPKL